MARFLIDEALPRSIARELRAAGHEADDVRDIGLRGQRDERIFQEAVNCEAILLTPDLGFSNTLRFPANAHSGIILLRLAHRTSVSRVTIRLLESIRELPLSDLAHSIVIVEPARTRIRRFA
jgi:predicted nuclease of predicted toxin-antitoxin system